MDYTNLPLWVKRIIIQVHLALKAKGVYYLHINDNPLDLTRDDEDIFCIRLRHRIKICATLPSGKTAKITIYHQTNKKPLVETEGITLILNRFIITRRIS